MAVTSGAKWQIHTSPIDAHPRSSQEPTGAGDKGRKAGRPRHRTFSLFYEGTWNSQSCFASVVSGNQQEPLVPKKKNRLEVRSPSSWTLCGIFLHPHALLSLPHRTSGGRHASFYVNTGRLSPNEAPVCRCRYSNGRTEQPDGNSATFSFEKGSLCVRACGLCARARIVAQCPIRNSSVDIALSTQSAPNLKKRSLLKFWLCRLCLACRWGSVVRGNSGKEGELSLRVDFVMSLIMIAVSALMASTDVGMWPRGFRSPPVPQWRAAFPTVVLLPYAFPSAPP